MHFNFLHLSPITTHIPVTFLYYLKGYLLISYMEESDPTLLTLAVIGNVLNFAYNVPLVWTVIKNNSARDISLLFLYLRIFGSVTWLIYSVIKPDLLIGISYIVTLSSSCIIYYVKMKETIRCIKPPPQNTNLTEV